MAILMGRLCHIKNQLFLLFGKRQAAVFSRVGQSVGRIIGEYNGSIIVLCRLNRIFIICFSLGRRDP